MTHRISIITGPIRAAVLMLSFATASEAASSSFSGRGNEPNWRVEIMDATITFQAMDANAITISPKPEAQASPRTETFLATVEGQAFSLTITDKVCVDTMSGMQYPKTVAVELASPEAKDPRQEAQANLL